MSESLGNPAFVVYRWLLMQRRDNDEYHSTARRSPLWHWVSVLAPPLQNTDDIFAAADDNLTQAVAELVQRGWVEIDDQGRVRAVAP
jgi:hypothetical protein